MNYKFIEVSVKKIEGAELEAVILFIFLIKYLLKK